MTGGDCLIKRLAPPPVLTLWASGQAQSARLDVRAVLAPHELVARIEAGHIASAGLELLSMRCVSGTELELMLRCTDTAPAGGFRAWWLSLTLATSQRSLVLVLQVRVHTPRADA